MARAHSRRRRILALGLAATLALGACTFGSDEAVPTPSNTGPSTAPSGEPDPDPGSGITPIRMEMPSGITLSPGKAATPAAPPAVVEGEPLEPSAIQAVFDRLPDWDGDEDLTEAFRWPVESIQPPRAGTEIENDFPAEQAEPIDPPVAPNTPVTVLRYQPEGDVSIAPFVSITFDQPMVPIATVGQLAAQDVPATITPDIPGSWQWIGTSTLRFDADSQIHDRLPMATTFTVTVPAGTQAPSGGTLAEEVSFTFSTPPPTVQGVTPLDDTMELDPIFVAAFDQIIDPAAVLDALVVTADDTEIAVRLATAAEIEADETARTAAAQIAEDRRLVFRPVDDLPTDAAVTLTFPEGTPSAEGPATTTKPASFSAHTYGPFAFKSADCNPTGCSDYSPSYRILFTNPIDTETFDPATVTVTPEVPGLVDFADNDAITVQGNLAGRTTYTTTIAAGLTDVFGQQLAENVTRETTTGSLDRQMEGWQPFTTLDAFAATPSLSVRSVNRKEFRQRIFRVTPADFPDYTTFVQKNMSADGLVHVQTPDWEVISDSVVTIESQEDTYVSTLVDLSAALPGADGSARGHVVVVIEPTESEKITQNEAWMNPALITWAQATTLGIDALPDGTDLRVWTTDLRTGVPLAGVTVGLLGIADAGTTDADGLGIVPLQGRKTTPLIVGDGEQTAILPATSYLWGEWSSSTMADEARWYVHDDRGTYRPGETAHLRGWVREMTSGTDAQLSAMSDGAAVKYQIYDAGGNVITDGTAPLGDLGGFEIEVDLPDGVALGDAYVSLELTGAGVTGSWQHSFMVADFRRPDFEVQTHTEGPGPYVLGEDLTVAADASYFAGGPLGAAPVQWQVRTAEATYAPPGWEQFTFGIWTPWWQESNDYGFGHRGGFSDMSYDYNCCYPEEEVQVDIFDGVTDAEGSNYLQLQVGDLGEDHAGLPVTVTTQATVTDVNRQTLAGSTDLLVHPADFYLGLDGDVTFVQPGDSLEISTIVTDVDGAAVAGRPVTVVLSRITSTWTNGALTETESDPQTCEVTSAATSVICTFTPTTGGTYRVSGTVADDRGRTARSQLTRWVSGVDTTISESVEGQALTLVPDKAEYAPGETAKILVRAPFAAGTGLVTTSRNTIIDSTTFTVADGSAVLEIPLTETDIPNLDLTIEVVGSTPRELGADSDAEILRSAYATGSLSLALSLDSRTLTVTATPGAATLTPGEDTTVDVAVTDSAGNPVAGSEFEVIVVDEAVLALSDFQLPDPLLAFYSPVSTWLNPTYGRANMVLTSRLTVERDDMATADSPMESSAASVPASAMEYSYDTNLRTTTTMSDGSYLVADQAGAAAPPIEVRQNFDALAVYQPSVITDAQGRATIDVPLPDNLTRYRVMVVAVAGADKFGTAEANITAQLPLTVRPSAPRFLNFGDTFDLPVLVQNLSTEDMTVDIALQATNLEITDGAGRRVEVPAGERVEVRFPVAAVEAGTAKFRVAAVSGDAADAAQVELPVYTPATTETVADYGVIDGDTVVAQPLLAPEGVIPQFGGLEITTSSTALAELTDAMIYLNEYTYDSSDALASRILAIAALSDVLAAFAVADLPTPEEISDRVDRDIATLLTLQNDDGGFGYWSRGELEVSPFSTIQAVHALTMAKDQGYTIPGKGLESGLYYLKEIDSHIPSEWSQSTKDTLRIYALHVRMVAGDRDTKRAKEFYDARGDSLELDALAWLWPVLDDPEAVAAIDLQVRNAAVDTAGDVTFTNEVSDSAWVTLRSDRRTDALILDALIRLQPDSDLIPKIVSGLMKGRVNGRWNNIQENSFILLAMKNYFDTYESSSPEFTARAWLGEQFAGEHTYSGHSTDHTAVNVPTAQLLEIGDAPITLQNDGTGRLYYRIGMRTAPADFDLDPLDRGFVVTRTYTAVDDPADVTRDEDGTWHIAAGARVTVTLELVTESARNHVALIDPLPAGLEILNPDLATTPEDLDPRAGNGDEPTMDAYGDFVDDPWFSSSWYRTWFDHQNLRDDRAEAMARNLQGGVYEYSYTARATTPGTFVVPPPRAEEIYSPETFGRGASDAVVIEG